MSGTQTSQNPATGLSIPAWVWAWLHYWLVGARMSFSRRRKNRRRRAELLRLRRGGLTAEEFWDVCPHRGTLGRHEWADVLVARGDAAAAFFAGRGCRHLAQEWGYMTTVARHVVHSRDALAAAPPPVERRAGTGRLQRPRERRSRHGRRVARRGSGGSKDPDPEPPPDLFLRRRNKSAGRGAGA